MCVSCNTLGGSVGIAYHHVIVHIPLIVISSLFCNGNSTGTVKSYTILATHCFLLYLW